MLSRLACAIGDDSYWALDTSCLTGPMNSYFNAHPVEALCAQHGRNMKRG